MPTIHPKARTTPAVRAEIARSTEPTGVLAQRYGVSTETIRKWRQRGAADCQDHSSRPHKLPWKATEEERAIVCALRRATGFPLDDLTFVVTHFLPAALYGSLRHPFRADMIRRRVTMKTQISASGGVGLGRGGRMSRQRKRDTVLRMLRGEDLETLSRALGVTAATLTGWQDTFVAAGEASLATRPTDGEALENERLKTKLGEMLLERELLEAKIAALEANRPLARRRSRP